MKPLKHYALAVFAGVTIAFMSAGPVFAQGGGRDLGTIFDGFVGQITSLSTMLTVGAFAIGVVMAIIGFMKFKAHNDNPNDPSAKLSSAFILLAVGAGLIALPATLGSGIKTIFGDGATTTNAEDGFTSIN